MNLTRITDLGFLGLGRDVRPKRYMHHDDILDTVTDAVEALLAASEPHDGLVPSLLDRESGTMRRTLPPEIAGQRNGDRAHLGANPVHDVPLLRTMRGLAAAGGDERYADGVERYLRRFATHCTDTTTGLFPWGEHAYWHLAEDRIGDSKQVGSPDREFDPLRKVPAWVWEHIQAADPGAVQRFADGLDYHFKDTDGTPVEVEYSRHAAIAEPWRSSLRGRTSVGGDRACDFPRHCGFYVFDLAFAYRQEQRARTRDRLTTFVDYWWEKRDPGLGGVLPLESRGRTDELHATQTLSLALSLLEAADLLDGTRGSAIGEETAAPDLAATMRERAATYIEGALGVPQSPETGTFRNVCRPRDLETGAFEARSGPDVTHEIVPMPTWAAGYGNAPAAKLGLMACKGYRATGDDRLLELAEAVGRTYATASLPEPGTPARAFGPGVRGSRHVAPEDEIHVPAAVPGLALGLLADLYDLTGDRSWLDAGKDLAGEAREVYWSAESPLPRGASGVDWYESQLGPAFLLHGLARVGLLGRDGRGGCPLEADYTYR